MTSVTATEARSNFAETLSRVHYGKESVLIERWGRPVAALVPIEQLPSLEELDTKLQAESESRLQDFAAVGIDNFWEMDEDFRLTFISRATGEKVAPQVLQGLGQTPWDIADDDPKQAAKWQAHREDLKAHRPFRDFRFSHPAPDGRTAHWRISGRPIFDGDGKFLGYRGTAVEETEDVEARRRAEIAEARLADAIASLGDGIALFDAEDRLVLCNRVHEEWSLSEFDTLVGRKFEDLLREKLARGDYVGVDTEEAREAWLRERMRIHLEPAGPIEQHHANRGWYRIHERRTQEGGFVLVSVDITESKRVEAELREAHDRLETAVEARTKDLWRANRLLLQEIAERKRIEEALRYSETRLAGILDIAPEAVIAIGEDRCIQLFNQGAEEIFGYTAEELHGRSIDILMPERSRSAHDAHVESFAASPETSRLLSGRGTLVGLRKDGTEFPAEASIAKLELEGGTIFTVLLRDITERKQDEQAMLAAKEKAELADRAKSEFLANISHELRTPLNAIIGFSEIMKRELLGPIGTPDYRGYADDITESGQHLLQLINDILDLSKIETGNIGLDETEVDVDDLVDTCRRLMAERAENGDVSVTVAASAGPRPALLADCRVLKQILVNLLSNAVKFTLPGGRVTVATRHGPNEGYVLEVADTGIGIAAADIPKAMDRFGQVESGLQRRFEGTGLGLPLTKSLVEAHGGTLEIESEAGVGTTVTVRFPPERIVG